MKFYFDESGNFAIPADTKIHSVAVVMGVAISEFIEQNLVAKFKEFTSKLNFSEMLNGEPKGCLLTSKHKYNFCDLLAEFDGISLTPVTLDLSSLNGTVYDKMNKGLADIISKQANRMIHNTAKQELLLLSKQHNNLSPQQAIRIYAVACCFREALEHSILFLSNRGHENYWGNLKFEIDRIHQKSNSREERVFSLLILAWLSTWSREKPFSLIQEIHIPTHPFVKKYDTSEGIDVGKIIRGNIYWENSRNSLGLQIADIASNIVFQAACNLGKDKESLFIYASLMRSSYYGNIRGPGLFSPIKGLSKDIKDRYRPLCEAMKWQESLLK